MSMLPTDRSIVLYQVSLMRTCRDKDGTVPSSDKTLGSLRMGSGLRDVVLNLLRGAVPERANEISSLWTAYGPTIEVVPSTSGVTMNANRHRIRFDTKTIDVFWLVGFSAWRS